MTYKMIFERDGNGWLVSCPEVQGFHAAGRTIEAARSHLRDALEVSLDHLPEDEAARVAATAVWEEDIRLPSEVQMDIGAARQIRQLADQVQQQASEALRSTVAKLEAVGLSRRDAATVLGLSHQRVQQLRG